ncbi:Serine acetyltransferase 3 [Abeliophyllum distichum]|uniref:serine O-acetyltransferase n=1 Tax=Abeliophyllum distichum TaxID=126358 RepID=A0ABD1PT27_9LAMI
MAASIDNSTNHARNLMADSHCRCQVGNFCRLIKMCTPSVRRMDSSNSIYQYGVKDSSKVIPQECSEDDIWQKIREEAKFYTKQEPILSKYYCSSILSHNSLESALANQLAIKLCEVNISREALYDVFLKALVKDGDIQRAIRDDLKAVKERDPACEQKLGRGIVFDHATGIVIGETAVIGNRVTILHDVTLGGTGKIEGDRHPKIGDGVMIGAGAKILGNIKIGENAKIGAGSVVLKEIPPRATAVGNPARLVGLR